MKTALKLKLELAIGKVILDNCEKSYWEGCIHDNLYVQMASAAALVFDSSMDGQKYAEDNK